MTLGTFGYEKPFFAVASRDGYLCGRVDGGGTTTEAERIAEPVAFVLSGRELRMMSLEPVPPISASSHAECVAVSKLTPGRSPRAKAVDPEHVAGLLETVEEWPPILVHRNDLVVIDGNHRLAAARKGRLDFLWVEFFDGSVADAVVESIRRNLGRGLPLTLAERKGGALELLAGHPDWSDRRIAQVCGLSAHTVGRIRVRNRATARGANRNGASRTARVGIDGRLRPDQPEDTRRAIADALATDPDASARAIATRVGASPTTVLAVRNRVGDASMRESRHGRTRPTVRAVPDLTPEPRTDWVSDSACRSTPEGFAFATWFDKCRPPDCRERHQYVDAVPLSRIYEVIDELARREQVWHQFVRELKARVPGN